MPEMNYNYEYLATITKAIQDLAEARAYDWYMFWLGVFGIIISGGIAGLAARYAYKLNEEQKKIAEKQKDISEEQSKIANKQADIMEQQNKIALFEHRFIYFKNLRSLRLNCARLKEKCIKTSKSIDNELVKNKNIECGKLKISLVAITSYNINEFNEFKDFKNNCILSYSNEILVKCIESIQPIKYIFAMNIDERLEFKTLLDLLIDFAGDVDELEFDTTIRKIENLESYISNLKIFIKLEEQLILINKKT